MASGRQDLQRAGLWPAVIAAFVAALSLVLVFRHDGPVDEPLPPELRDGAPLLSVEPDSTSANRYPYSPPEWRQRDPGPLVSRMGFAAAWSGSELLVWGGSSLLDDYTSGAMFDPSAVRVPAWSNMIRPPIAGGNVDAATWTGEHLFVYTTGPARFDPATNEWTGLEAVPGRFRALSATATPDGVVVIGSGGRDGATATTVAFEYARDGDCCEELPPLPADLTHATALWASDRLMVIGAGPFDDALRHLSYEPGQGRWIELADADLDPGRGLAAVWTGTELVAVDITLATAVWTADHGWTAAPPAPFDDLSCWPRATALGGDAFVWYCRRAAVFSPATGAWSPVPTPELPSHTISTSCLPVGTERTVLVWCGNGDGAGPILWEYDPS